MAEGSGAYVEQHGPKGSGGGGGKGERHHRRREVIFSRAYSGVINSLLGRGFDQSAAEHYAGLLLSRPGVTITPKGIRWHDKKFAYDAFAKTPLANLITGIRAKNQNEAAIKSEPGYLQALSELGLERDLATGGLDDQRRRSILDFGDPRFANDPLLAAEAGANPFSLSRALDLAHTNALGQVQQTANRTGTLFGGGYQSGVNEENRLAGARQFDATRSLEDLLTSLDRQKAQAQQIYGVGQSSALQDASQRLLASGALHAAKPPTLKMHPYQIRLPWRRPGHKIVNYAP